MKVRIFTPAKTAMQSGRGRTRDVVVEVADLGARAPEPLMGWVSSSDTMNQVRLTLPTVESAVAYANSNGYEYEIVAPQVRRVRPRNYTDNFKYLPPETAEEKRG